MSHQDEREATPERAETVDDLEPKQLSADAANTVKGGWHELVILGDVAAARKRIDHSSPKI